MQDSYEKYANLLLKACLNIKKGEPLLINFNIENIDFVRVLARRAYELGVNDIYFDYDDEVLRHDQLECLTVSDLNNSNFFNKKVWDEYASKGSAFLMLLGDDPDLMNDIDPDIIGESSKIIRTSKPLYKEKQSINEISWCIACTATEKLAKKIFPDTDNAKELLWEQIFKMCLVDKDDPIKEWNQKIENTDKRCKILNELKFKELHYTNDLGTDLYIKLDKDTLWAGGAEKLQDGRLAIMNMPTEEVFTTPIKDGTNGKVFSSKPLVYSGTLIEDIMVEFKDGKVIDYDAKSGKDVLKSIIEGDDYSCYLGEVALVDYDSPISNSNLIFYETLYDENASCHLALGNGFPTCNKNYKGKSKEELLEMGINQSTIHVDFMIGTKDLNITGITYDEEEITVFEDGNFVIEQ